MEVVGGVRGSRTSYPNPDVGFVQNREAVVCYTCICHVHAHAMHARDVYVITSLIWIDIITVNKIVSSVSPLLSVL